MADKMITIPEYIDSPVQILFLEADDFIPFFTGVGIGILFKYIIHNSWSFIIGIIIGGILTKIYLKFKRNTLPGTLAHMLYAYGIIKLNKRFDNGLIKRVNQ